MGSILLHAGVAAALLISWPWARDLKVGAVVPVTIVANAPVTNLRAAEQAPVEQTAQTEAPVPDAPVETSPPPPPAPTPTPPRPVPTPAPTPKAAPPKAAPTPAPKAAQTPAPKTPPTKAQPKPAEKGLDFDALLASIPASKSAPRPSSAQKGASRAETAPQARPNLGTGLDAAAAMNGLVNELQRRWNPNCAVEGGRAVVVRVTFQVGSGGGLVGDPTAEIRGPRNSESQAAADRAVRAVYAAAPFRTLPREFYGQRVAVNFNAREACQS
jgi:outer membrane biosynthesis protein TonB